MKYLLDIQKGLGIMETKKIQSLEDLRNLVICCIKDSLSVDDTIRIINSDYEVLFNLKGIPLTQIISLIYCKYKNDIDEIKEFSEIGIYESEFLFLKDIVNVSERKILYTLLVLSKYNDHPSGWIKYEKDFIFELWGLKLSNKQKTELLNQCCEDGIELSVVGSKNPIICFKVKFRDIDNNLFIKIPTFKDLKKIYFELFGE